MLPFSLDSGRLEDVPAVRLFAAAKLSNLTGTFTLERDELTKWVLFHKGQLVGARSSQLSDSLGRLLVQWGLIDRDSYVASLEKMDEGKMKHGEILVEMGVLKEEQIAPALSKQLLTRVANAVSWTAGTYKFSAGETHESTGVDLWKAFLEGMYRRHGPAGITEAASRYKNLVPRRIGGILESFLLSVADVTAIYEAIDGKRPVNELGRNATNQKVFFTNLLVLEELGLIELGEPADADPLERAYKKARKLSPANLLRVDENATAEDIHAAVGKLLKKFPVETYGESQYFTPLVTLIEKAEKKLLVSGAKKRGKGRDVSVQAEREFQLGKNYLEKKQLSFALQKFEEAVFHAPDAAELRGYLAWAQFREAPTDDYRRRRAENEIEAAVVADPDDPDLHAFLGSLLKLSGRHIEAKVALTRALELKPGHPLAERELESVELRLRAPREANDVDPREIDGDAKIVVQRWIGGQSVVMNFTKDDIRIGSGPKDDLTVSDSVLPQVTPFHCNVLLRDGRFIVRRNGSAGLVLMNGRQLQAREEVTVTAQDRVTLGQPEKGPVLEFRVLDEAFMANLRAKSKEKAESNNVWLG